MVGWRGLAQRDPLNEYKQEAYELFQALLTNLRELVTTQLSHVEIQMRQPEPPRRLDLSQSLSEIHVDPTTGENDAETDVTGTLGTATAAAGIAGRWQRRPGRRRSAPASDRPQAPRRGVPQRPLPLRLGPQVQALPRQLLSLTGLRLKEAASGRPFAFWPR